MLQVETTSKVIMVMVTVMGIEAVGVSEDHVGVVPLMAKAGTAVEDKCKMVMATEATQTRIGAEVVASTRATLRTQTTDKILIKETITQVAMVASTSTPIEEG